MIDMHCHAWEHWPYQPSVSDPKEHGSVGQLLDQMDQHEVERAAIVAACIDHNPTNNDYVASAVERHPDRLVHIADIDSMWSAQYHQPGAAERLTALVERFEPRGITHYVRPENDGWLRTSEADEFFGAAADHGLFVSLSCKPSWQEDLRHVAAKHPTVQILCHHLAGLRTSSTVDDVDAVLASANCSNISVKISGFHYAAESAWEFPYTLAHQLTRRLVDAFGASRCLWGSDFPVAKKHLTYRQSFEMVASQLDLTAAERALILHGSASALLTPNPQ